jgi:SEC-C motif-containing protein
MHITTDSTCPCGSALRYSECCQRLHNGAFAETAEALMRSRYTAFVLKLSDYLKQSWHASTRPNSLELDNRTQWKRLEILASHNNNETGEVHFKAYFIEDGGWQVIEERSKFLYQDQHWYYLTGDYKPKTLKPNRNDPCPCGSGKKFKKCCI